MSFAATLGLVALVQIGMPRLFASPDNSATAKVALWGGREIMTLALASLVAGLATTPYAAFHFHRVTPYGVLANLAAMPVVSAVVMPAGLLGLLAMPFGFDGVFWWLMGVGIDWMIAVTRWVADLPGAVGRMAAFGTGPLIAASLGIILLGLLRTPLRWSGAAVLALSVAWALALPQPDILISADGHNVGVRGKDGRLHLMRVAKDSFLLKEWLAADADPRGPADSSLADGVSCDEAGCVTEMADGRPGRAGAQARGIERRLRALSTVGDREADAGFMLVRGDVGGSLAQAGCDRAMAKARFLCRRRGQAQGRRPAVVAGRGRRWRSRAGPAAARSPARGRRDAGGSRSAGGGVRVGRFTSRRAPGSAAVRRRRDEIPPRRRSRSPPRS